MNKTTATVITKNNRTLFVTTFVEDDKKTYFAVGDLGSYGITCKYLTSTEDESVKLAEYFLDTAEMFDNNGRLLSDRIKANKEVVAKIIANSGIQTIKY